MNILTLGGSAAETGRAPPSAVSETDEVFGGKKALVVVAHPDDAVLFAGSILPLFREIFLLHTTDGAPSREVARRKGFARRLDYFRARRRELEEALAAGGIHATLLALPIRDGCAALFVDRILREVAALIENFAPEVILTHAYEGGHRDHDTTVFAVCTAARRAGVLDRVWEMACYHGTDDPSRE